MRFRKLWLKMKLVNFDFSAKSSSTDYNEPNKPTLNLDQLIYRQFCLNVVDLD